MAKGADQPFPDALLKFFGCEVGAFSPVTRTEAQDGQVTLTGIEKEIALKFFGEAELAQYRGNDDDLLAKGLDAGRRFRKFPEGNFVYPKLKYAKTSGTELRLYFNEDDFKVCRGNFWGIFVKNGDIWLCDFSPWWLEDITSGRTTSLDFSVPLEPENDDYQEIVNEGPPEKIASATLSWKRNPKIAADAFAKNGYVCELRPDLETFLGRSTGKPFLEAHHLIPMKAQSAFRNVSLDCVENICVLSPFAHRKLHHASFDEIRSDLLSLAASRKDFFQRLEINEDFLFSAYEN